MFAKHVGRDVNVFIFFKKQSFHYEKDDEKSKLKRSFFQKQWFLKNNRIKNCHKSFLKQQSFSKTIVIRFLKVQNKRVIFTNNHLFTKTKRSFLKTIKNETKNDRLMINN